MQDPSHDRRRHHHDRHRDATKRGGPKTPESPIKLSPGQVVFRMLCHVNTVGGVKGGSGLIIKHLESDTGAKIQVEPTIPSCLERVINVIGYAEIGRKITLKGDEGFAEDYEVSQAQEALFRVFERLLVVEGTSDGVIGCRLLAGIGQVGLVMGKGGNILDKIRKTTGTKIRVLPVDQLPACASQSDKLIQIMGGVLAVKKAVLAVSSRLQLHSPIEIAPVDISSCTLFPNPHSEFPLHHNPLLPPLRSSSVDYAIDHSLSADVDRILSLDEASTKLKIVFRLLCSISAVGAVIGKGATIVRALENETGASIKMAASVAGSKERVATVTAMENPEQLFSPAQAAVIRVFAKSIEVDIGRGHVAGLRKMENVTARLLVASDQVGCLIDGGRVAKVISTVLGVDIQILGGELVPNCAGGDDKVIQIVGEYENVKSALLRVTGRLRDNLFTSKAFGGARTRNYSYSAIPDISHERGGDIISAGLDHSSGFSSFDQKMTEAQGMDYSGLLQNLGDPISARLRSLQATGIGNVRDLTDSGRGLTTFGYTHEHGRSVLHQINHQSTEPAVVKNTTVEVVVPKSLFLHIYGEDGCNLARLKQISGAKVKVRDPCPGENEGKVTVTGTPDQTLMAQSLLQAFILNV